MIDHLSLGVTDLARSIRFYSELFAPLGYALQHDNAQEAAFGPGTDRTFWLYPATNHVAVRGMHVAFAAKTHAEVDAAFAAAMSNGGTASVEPGRRPDVSDHYYGCIILDPDGHRLEVVGTESPDLTRSSTTLVV